MDDVDLSKQGATASQPSGRSGDRPSLNLDRLLQSAGQVRNAAEPATVPFGFDTRVVALWRAGANNNGNGLARLLRRVAVLATAVIVISTAAAFRELNRSREIDEPLTNEFAIADSAIQDEISQ